MPSLFSSSAIARVTGFTSLVLLAIATPVHAAYESFTLSPGFRPDPAVGTGESGGSRQTSCGYVDSAGAPDHVLTLQDAFEYLRVSVESEGDVSLLIEGPGGQICSDDVVGLLPEVEGYWPEGTYRFWIGDFNQAGYDYTLRISQNSRNNSDQSDSQDSPDLTLEPGFSPSRQVLRGRSGGDRQTDCGYMKRSSEPNHVVELAEPFEYLRASVSAPGDVTLLIAGPGGEICSDDVVDLLPQIEGYWPEGTYRFWIGDFTQAGYSYELTFSESRSNENDHDSSDAQRRSFGNLPSIGDFTVIRNTYYDDEPFREFDAEVDGVRQRWWANCDTNALGTGERTAPPSSHARTIAEYVCED